MRAARLARDVGRDIHRGIADADDEHILVAIAVRRAEVMRMDDIAAEMAGKLRHAGLPEVTIGNDDLSVVADRSIREAVFPATVPRRDLDNFGPEADMAADAEAIGVVFQIVQDLPIREE